MPATTPTMSWPVTVDELSKLVQVNLESCHGQTREKQRCKKGIKRKSVRISNLLEEIVRLGEFTASKSCLQQLSALVVCETHSSQASAQLSGWEDVLRLIKPLTVKAQHHFRVSLSSLGSEAVIKVKSSASLLDVETSVKFMTQANTTNPLPSLLTSSPQTSPQTTPKKPSPKKVSPSKTIPLTDIQTKHYFKPYSTPKSMPEINKAIKGLILRPLTVNEKKSGGFVYVYTFPSEYHAAAPYLKIGHAKDVNARMKRWRGSCGYTPMVLSQFDACLFVKVESIVHKHFVNERKIEQGCPKCGVYHQEWFNTNHSDVSGLIARWTGWTRRMPYDEAGNLKKKWVKKLEFLDLADPECWKDFVEESEGEREMESEEEGEDESEDERELFEVEDETALSEQDSFQWSDDSGVDDSDEEEYECYDDK